MVLTDDTVTAILDTMKDTMKETMDKMIEFQNENAKLNREMLERILSNQQTNHSVNKPATTKQLEQAGKSQSLAEDSIGDKVDETDDANEDADDKKFNGPLFPQDADDRYAESYNRQFGDFGMPPRNNAPKPVRPEIKEGCGEFGWQLFLDRWQRYKKTAKLLTTSEICLELRNACHENVDKLLFEFVGAKELNSTRLTEKALLDHIKHVAVGSTHKDYERWKFNQICQQEGEPVTKFVARLKAQALLCDFNIHVSAGNTKVAHSYAEDMISQRLTSGVINPEHREKLLSEAPNMKSLKEKVDKLMSLEATEQVSSKFQMSSPTISAPGRSPSQFKKFKNQRRFTADDRPSRRGRSRDRGKDRGKERCRGCGRTSHPNGKPVDRKYCPAQGKACDNCGRDDHFRKMCPEEPSKDTRYPKTSRSAFARSDEESGNEMTSGSDHSYCYSEDSYSEDEEQYSYSSHGAARAVYQKEEDFRRRRCRRCRK